MRLHPPFLLRSVLAALVACLLLGAGAPAQGSDEKADAKVQWLAFDAAVAKAQKENKHLLVDLYTNWCGWCKVMDRQTYGNPEVAAYLTENFSLAKVNGESSAKMTWNGKTITERDFARAVRVTGYPATYFMKPNAEILGGVQGYIKSPDMMIYARFVKTKYYERGTLQQFADSLKNVGS